VSAPVASPLVLIIVGVYLALLIGLGLLSRARFRGTSRDYFVAERSIGPFVLLMSIFGTTMTAFALVGSTGAAFDRGIGVYGLMASSSGIIHSLIFFLIGIRLWAIGKRHEFLTQIQYFRARFESPRLGYVLFPILVSMVLI
jgi:SSS family solute:Na+ symporter